MSAVDPLVVAHVIQDVLDPFTPTTPLRIAYNNRLLLPGTELRPSAVVSKPRVDIGGNDMRVLYTLVSRAIFKNVFLSGLVDGICKPFGYLTTTSITRFVQGLLVFL